MPSNEPKQTFIPKKSIGEEKKTRKRSWGLFFGIAVVIFIITAAASGGVYAYRAYLEQRVESASTSLERAKQAFEPSLIRELKRLNTRMDAGGQVLSQHLSLSSFFSELSDLTLETVRFTRFDYSFNNQGTAQISLSGMAEGYSSVALQSDAFADHPFIKNPIFSNLGLDEDGAVTFDVTANIDPVLISYEGSLSGSQGSGQSNNQNQNE